MVTAAFAAALLLGSVTAQTQGNEDVNGGGSGPSASVGHDGGGDEHPFVGSGLFVEIGSGSGSDDPEPCSLDTDEVSAFLATIDEDCGATLVAAVYGTADSATTAEALCGCVSQANVDSMPDCEVNGIVFDADLHHQCMLMPPGQGSGSGDLEPSPTAAPWHQTKSPTAATAALTSSPTAAPWAQTKSPSTVQSPTAVPNQYRYMWSRAPTPFILEFDDDFGLGLPVGSGPSNAQNDEDGKGGAFVVFIVLLVAATVFLSTAIAVRKYREKDVGSADTDTDFDSESAVLPVCDAATASTTDLATDLTTDLTTKPISVNPAYDTPLSYTADNAAEPVYSSAEPACGKGNAAAAEPVYHVGDARASVGYDIVDARGSVVYDIGDARGSVVYDMGDARGSVVYDLGTSEDAIPEEDDEDGEDGVPVSRLISKTDPVRPARSSSVVTDWGDNDAPDTDAPGQAYENNLMEETDVFQDTDGEDNGPVHTRNTPAVVRRESLV
jgi:hypothetical protein